RSVRMSRSAPSAGIATLPASDTPITGHGFGLAWQKRRKSSAQSRGRIARLPCTKPGARPDVAPSKPPERLASRTSRPVRNAVTVPCIGALSGFNARSQHRLLMLSNRAFGWTLISFPYQDPGAGEATDRLQDHR